MQFAHIMQSSNQRFIGRPSYKTYSRSKILFWLSRKLQNSLFCHLIITLYSDLLSQGRSTNLWREVPAIQA